MYAVVESFWQVSCFLLFHQAQFCCVKSRLKNLISIGGIMGVLISYNLRSVQFLSTLTNHDLASLLVLDRTQSITIVTFYLQVSNHLCALYVTQHSLASTVLTTTCWYITTRVASPVKTVAESSDILVILRSVICFCVCFCQGSLTGFFSAAVAVKYVWPLIQSGKNSTGLVKVLRNYLVW